MVGVAQLVEPWIVIPVVVGSSPIAHPINKDVNGAHNGSGQNTLSKACPRQCPEGTETFGPLAQLVEQLTLNQLVVGSSPTWPTKYRKPGQRRAFLHGDGVARLNPKALSLSIQPCCQ